MSTPDVFLYSFRPVMAKFGDQFVEVSLRDVRDTVEVLAKARIETGLGQAESHFVDCKIGAGIAVEQPLYPKSGKYQFF